MVDEHGIVASGLVREFKKGPRAVDGIDLLVHPGEIFGFLGPNGAGKSTTMKLLTAQAVADEGELEVLGHPLPGESKAARAQCGVVPQLDNLDETLTVEQIQAWGWRIGFLVGGGATCRSRSGGCSATWT